jgi:hypothetical protein
MRKKNYIQVINHFLILFSFATLLSSCNQPPQDLKSALEKIPGVTVNVLEPDTFFNESFELWFTQPVDHNKPDGETFQQRVLVGHVGFDKPTVAILEGYSIYTEKPGELSKLLQANQITIEHRFFAKSRPDSIPWSFLTTKQAATDHHKIIKALKKFYRGKWVSTGISKGGQTTIYHRYYYPKDVDVSVPYVAPLNFSDEDERVYTFLKNVGTEECRQKIYDFQISLFENKEKLMPFIKNYAAENNYSFSMGIDRAFDLSVLEYSFAFWQWCGNCENIPDEDASIVEMFENFKTVNPLSFFDDNDVDYNRPFFYQALTEIGMYGYEIEPFKQYLKDTSNITFEFTLPDGVSANFDTSSMRNIDRWIKAEGNNMLYIYGQNDAWSSTAVEPSKTTNAVIMFNPGGCHETRIKSFPDKMKDSIYTVLENWLDIDINKDYKNKTISSENVFEIL